MRRGVMDRIRGTFFALVLLGMLTGAACAQTTKDGPQQSGDAAAAAQKPAAQQESKTDDTATEKAAAAKPMTPEEARQAQLVADTNKLLELSQELKAEVAKSSKDTLSLAVVKKAAEVEKLAKSLKERMRNNQ
jgi:nitrate reductase cytochrome c-type subunit